MARIKIEMPADFSFQTEIPIRITDLNYAGHVGNDIFLSIIHEARVQFLAHHQYKELDIEGAGLIMSDVAIEFKNEVFYGELIRVSVTAAGFSKVSFEIFYKLEKQSREKPVLVALAKTGMVCYNYQLKKMVAIPDRVRVRLNG
jgi:acyl-CoA thioester hydrolase